MKHHFQVPRAHFSYSVLSIAVLFALSSASTMVSAQTTPDEPTIVVSAARSEQVVTDALPHTTVIGRDTIEKSPASDVVSLLKMQSGLSITQNGTQGSLTGVRIRGGEVRHTLILIDGVPMNSLSAGFPALEQIPLSSIERIEVVRGNVSALYGSQAVGGLVQIFTRKPNGNDATIRVAAGNRGQRQASVQVRGGNEVVQATFGISHEQVKAVSSQNVKDVARENPFSTVNPDKDGYKNNSANGHIRYRPNTNHEFGLQFFESRGKNNYDNAYGSSDEAVQYNKTRVQNISLYAHNQFTKNWKSDVRLSQYTDRSNDFDKPSFWGTGESRFQTRTKEASWQNNIHSNFGEFIVGVSRTHQKLSSDTVYDNSKRTTTSAWVGYNLDKARHHLQLNARTDKLSDIGRENTAAVNYGFDVTDKVKVFAGYSNGFSAPNFNELFYPGYSNPDLKAEHATYTQAGVQYTDNDFGGRVTLFETRYRDKIASDSMTFLPYNVNRAKAQGIEWSGWYNVNGWNFESSLTYQAVKDRATGERLIRQPRILASLGVGKSWGKWNAQVNWQAQGNATDTGKTKVGGYGVINTALSYSPQDNLKIGLSVGNIFNRHYQTVYGYNSMPRNFLLSLQYQPKW